MRLLFLFIIGWLSASIALTPVFAAEGAIVLNVTPDDAEIWLDGKLVANKSPAYLKVEEGRHQVEIRKQGYDNQVLDVIVSVGVVSRAVKLSVATTGTLVVTTSPVGADIYIDGQFAGNTSTNPLSMTAFPGQRKLEAKKVGYNPVNTTAYITAGGASSVEMLLERTPPTMVEWLDPPPPVKDAFETAEEFAVRQRDFERKKVELLHEFNSFVGKPEFAAGKVTLDKNEYDIVSGIWPIMITQSLWAAKRWSPAGWETWITLSRDDARKLFADGAEQYVYVTFNDDGKADKWVVAGGGARYPVSWGNLILSNLPPPKMVAIPPGSFTMGSTDGDSNGKPVHRVTIGTAFELSATPITFDQWDACLADGGCGGYKPGDGWGRGKYPVINVSWNDAQNYIAWLNRKTGKTFRLPTEAEWEYAARGGTTTTYWWGDAVGTNNANCNGCGNRWDGRQTAPVASFRANPFGLYDMLGNVFQWVQDCYADNYQNAPADGSAVLENNSCDVRVLRGGSWSYSPNYLRSAYRGGYNPGIRGYDIGFRVARTVTP